MNDNLESNLFSGQVQQVGLALGTSGRGLKSTARFCTRMGMSSICLTEPGVLPRRGLMCSQISCGLTTLS